MTVILDTRFPESIERGFHGSALRFNTSVFYKARGQTTRNINWTQSVGRWTCAIGFRDTGDEDYQTVRNMIGACRGRAYGFLFKDWEDYHCADAVHDGGVYYKPYRVYEADGTTVAGEYLRPITRIIASTMIGSGDGASFDFLVPVAFTSDFIESEMETDELAQIPQIEIEEVLE